MRYYLDFDRTIFDTDAFVAYWQARVAADGGQEEQFAPGELSQFLYADAAQFLRDKENAVTIITFGTADFQEAKIKSALHGIPRMSVMYTGEVRKGDFLAPHTHLHADAVLVDDSPEELEILARTCPDLGLYEIRRDGGMGDGRWPVVRVVGEVA
mgnify:CR=1 FL=1